MQSLQKWNCIFKPTLTVIKIICNDINKFGDIISHNECPHESDPINIFVHVVASHISENPCKVLVQTWYLIPVRIILNIQSGKNGQSSIEGENRSGFQG